MTKYKIELRPIVVFGHDKLSSEKKMQLEIMLEAIVKMLPMVDGVSSASIGDNYTIYVEASEDVEKELKKFHDEVIVTRLE